MIAYASEMLAHALEMIAQAHPKFHTYGSDEKIMKTLLITAIGSFSAKTAIEAAKELGFKTIGCDIYPREWVSQSLLVDGFYRAVPATDVDAYMQFIKEVCDKENVDLILPLTDPEVDVLSARRGELSAEVALSHDDIITTCRDKMIFCTHMKGLIDAIPTAWVSDVETPESFPVIVKPVRGRSSHGMRKLDTQEEYTAFREAVCARREADGCKGSGAADASATDGAASRTTSGAAVDGKASSASASVSADGSEASASAGASTTPAAHGDYIVQPYIPGRVVSVDIFRDPRNGYIYTLPREELLRTPAGAGTSVRIYHDEFIEDDSKFFAELFGIKGTVMLEFIVDKTGYSWAMECNPRFSGGIGFSKAAGWDFAKAHLAVYADMHYEMPPEIGETWIVKEYSEVITRRESK